ncbi:hypothetical protein [Nonomuraea sp. NPDC049480]|uniref:hypothetical protein n=1 Tax=Nonomuraea sp. NPDC049480 TaxID=3364353 RepID=UPI003797B56E
MIGLNAVLGARVEARPVLLAAGKLHSAAYAVGAGRVTDWIADRSTQTLHPHTPTASSAADERA